MFTFSFMKHFASQIIIIVNESLKMNVKWSKWKYLIFLLMELEQLFSVKRWLRVISCAAYFYYFFKFIYFLVLVMLVFTAKHKLSPFEVSGEHSLLCLKAFSWWWPFLWSTGSRAHGLQWLWHMDLATSWHVESSWTRGQTGIPCICNWTLTTVLAGKSSIY